MSSESIAAPLAKVTDILDPISKPLSKGLGALGIPDPIAGGVGKGLTGGLLFGTPAGIPAGVGAGVQRKNELEQAKAQKESNEAARLQANEDIFALAKRLTGTTARQENAFFDLEQLQFKGEDPRQAMLEALVEGLSGRQASVQGQTFTPGLSQTRLALVQ